MRTRSERDTPRTMRLLWVFAALALVVAACGSDDNSAETTTTTAAATATTAAPACYEGNDVEVIVPLGPGGGTDVAARIISKYLEKHLAGNPTVQVVNIEGGGDTRIGHNEYGTRDHDGLTLFMAGSSNLQAELYGAEGYDYSLGILAPIAGTTAGSVMLARTDTGVVDGTAMMTADVEWFNGDRGPRSGFLSRITALNLLGVDTTDLFGFESASAVHLAFEQGELNMNGYSTSQYLKNGVPMIEAGDAAVVFQLGRLAGGEVVKDDAYSADIPTPRDLYVAANGEEPGGIEWEAYKMQLGAVWMVDKSMYVHGDAPQGCIDELRTAIEAVAIDDEFLAEGVKLLGGYPLLNWKGLEKVVDTYVTGADPAVVQWVVDFVLEEYDVDLRG